MVKNLTTYVAPVTISPQLNSQVFRFILIWPIRLYQKLISPLLGSNCRFQPTCSHYAIGAIEEWGIFKGGWLALKRIFRCHPWGGSGYDPWPVKSQGISKTDS